MKKISIIKKLHKCILIQLLAIKNKYLNEHQTQL